MTDQKTEQKPADHKAIREAARVGGDYTMVEVPDLRALLADLDAMRADAQRYAAFFTSGLPVCFEGQEHYSKADCDAAIDAALTAAKAGGWVAVPVEPTPEMIHEVEHASRLGAVWTAASVYKAMLAARPLPNPPKEQSAGGLGSLDDGA